VIVIVEDALVSPGVTDGGLKLTEAPWGRPVAVRSTATGNPTVAVEVTVTVKLAEAPGIMNCSSGVMESVKPPTTCSTVLEREGVWKLSPP